MNNKKIVVEDHIGSTEGLECKYCMLPEGTDVG